MPDEKKRGRGRPEIEIDLKTLESLCQLGCTNREIAFSMGCSERTIEKRRRKADFREAMERGEAKANISLRRKQLELAMKGDKTMLIWLGKQRLGQKDRIDTAHHDVKPPVIHVNFVDPEGDEEN